MVGTIRSLYPYRNQYIARAAPPDDTDEQRKKNAPE
jgi:hypothetical protein